MSPRHPALCAMSALVLSLALALPPGPAWAAPLAFPATAGGTGGAVLELQADKLVTMTAIPFRLTIRDAQGQPVTGARVNCNLTMPSMRMPDNRPKLTERDGAYVGELILTCTMGDYRAECVVEEAGGARRTLAFDIGRARLK